MSPISPHFDLKPSLDFSSKTIHHSNMSNDHQIGASPSDSSPEVLFETVPIILHPDGSIRRVHQLPTVPATPDLNSSSPVLCKDVPLNPQHNTWVRVYLPRKALESPSTANLPLIVYFHGGGFVICSAATVSFHNFCAEMADQIGAVVVSVDYRLAPEHRLPAAYDDAMEALHWIRTSEDKWVRDFADISSCFLMGSSAGGNIVYHAGLRAAAAADDLLPMKIKGLVLHQPAFGGSERTASELRLVNDSIIPLFVADVLWQLALPIGADRDHEYCNPMVKSESDSQEQMKRLGWRVMVTDCDGDPLVDRVILFAKLLEMKGLRVVTQFDEGGYHSVEIRDPTRTSTFLSSLKNFFSME